MSDEMRDRLFDILEQETRDDRTQRVRLAELGCQRLPTHKEHITNMIASLENDGLVHTTRGRTQVRLSEKGREVIEDE